MKVHPSNFLVIISFLTLVSGCVGPRGRLTLAPARPGADLPKAVPGPAPQPKAVAAAKPAPSMYWKAEGVNGSPRIVVALSQQRAYFYKGETLVAETPVSSGRKGFETPAGSYNVVQKDEKHVSNLYGDYVDDGGAVLKKNVDTSKQATPEGISFKGASMPYFLRFQGGYGLHAGRIPGYAASHGCVRLPRQMARRFFESSQVGTPVLVKN